MLWQLKKLSNGKALNDPGKLPNDWGPIFGLHNIKDKLSDLSWLGPAYSDMGWVEVEGDLPKPPPEATLEEKEKLRVKELLDNSDWAMMPDVPMTVGEKEKWIKYRADLRQVKNQSGFPNNIIWPQRPE